MKRARDHVFIERVLKGSTVALGWEDQHTQKSFPRLVKVKSLFRSSGTYACIKA